MMKDKVSSVKLKGTVLYTVVSVLMVLIVFLMGTLALAATASNRAYTNYQKEQTEYTARTVLDAVITSIERDNSNNGIRSEMVSNLKNKNDSMTVDVDLEGTTHTATITNIGEQEIYNPDESRWVKSPIYEVTTTFNKALTGTTYSAIIMAKNEIDDDVPKKPYGFVSMGDIGGKEIATGGFITGGTYIGVGHGMEDYTIGDHGETTVDAPFYVNGNVKVNNEMYMHYRHNGDYFTIIGDMDIVSGGGIIPIYDGFVWDDQTYEALPYIYVGGTMRVKEHTSVGSEDVATNIYCGAINVDSEKGFQLHGDLYCFDTTKTSEIGGTAASSRLYEWAEKQLMKKSGDYADIGSWYSMGSVLMHGNNPITIEGDLRVEKDITIESGARVTVEGDIVCGGKLTVGSGASLSCGNIYATEFVNSGNINSTGSTIHANIITNNGTIVSTSSTGTATRWYEGVSATWTDNGYTDWQGKPVYTVNYTYTKHESINGGAETVTTETGANHYFPSSDINAEWQTALPAAVLTYNSAANVQTETLTSTTPITPAAQPATVESVYGEIYPEDYTRNNLAKMEIPDSKALADITSQPTPTTIEELSDIYDATLGGIQVMTYDASMSVDNNPADKVAPVPLDATGQYFEVNNSCIITGTLERNLYINPGAGNSITVVLDDVEMDQDGDSGYDSTSIIINDISKVTLFISGTVLVDKGVIITTDYLDLFFGAGNWTHATKVSSLTGMLNELTVTQVQPKGSNYLPNVMIYGEENSTLDLSRNNSMVTAQIKAPKMVFSQSIGLELPKTIHYISPYGGTMDYGSGASSYNSTIGVIGSLEAGQIKMNNSARWGMLFVQEADGGSVTCPCSCAGCTKTTPASCTCACSDPTCICSGNSIPKYFTTAYFNFY